MEETTALSVYNGEEQDEFPVLKAFQQYIDAEQAKARQRMLSLSIFFGVMLTIVVVVFVILLTSASQRNQMLNDRLVDFAMKERQNASSVIVQQPQAVDNSAILALTARLDEIQKNLDKARQEALEKDKLHEEALKSAQQQVRSQESMEIERLKDLLKKERESAAKARDEMREAELEAYRRKHYPEYFAKKEQVKETAEATVEATKEEVVEEEEKDPIQELLDDLDAKDDNEAIKYFDDDEEEDADEEGAEEDVKRSSLPSWQIPS